MNHIELARSYSQQMEQHPGHLALILFGSVARGTFRPTSDLDFLLLHKNFPPNFRYEETYLEGIKIGTSHLDYGYFRNEVIVRPFNRVVLTEAQVMFDKTGNVPVWIAAINRFFTDNSDIKEEWDKLRADYELSKTQLGIQVKDILMFIGYLEEDIETESCKKISPKSLKFDIVCC